MMSGLTLLMAVNAVVLVCSSQFPKTGDGVVEPRTTTISFEQNKRKLTNISVENGPNGETRNWKAKLKWGGINLDSRTNCNSNLMHVDLMSGDKDSLTFGGSGDMGGRCGSHVVFQDDMDGSCPLVSGDFDQLKAYVKK
jgi:hypothetical protein